MHSEYYILITVDVEDWFQVENLKRTISFKSWPTRELRVEKNTHRLLDLFDQASFQRSAEEALCDNQLITDKWEQKKLRATFFVLGWIAERLPNLVREIQSRGHEVASHGYCHELCSQCSIGDLKADIVKSKRLLEDIIGGPVYGYRAPNFSIGDEILKIIAEAGYLYDSSYNSFGMHGRYGEISLNGHERKGIAYKISPGFYELPISNLILRGPFSSQAFDPGQDSKLSALSSEQSRTSFVLPWGGGAYFRLIPGPFFRIGVREILKQQQAYLFYVHPWEIDPEQPRPEGTKVFSRFRHYTNLKETEGKLRSLLLKFSACRFVTCREHLEKNEVEHRN